MSQNIITLSGPAGHDVQIRVGWDRPLSTWFSLVEQADDDPSDYSSLHLANFADVRDLARAFQRVGMPLPEAVLAAVEDDGIRGIGNLIREFSPTGVKIRESAF